MKKYWRVAAMCAVLLAVVSCGESGSTDDQADGGPDSSAVAEDVQSPTTTTSEVTTTTTTPAPADGERLGSLVADGYYSSLFLTPLGAATIENLDTGTVNPDVLRVSVVTVEGDEVSYELDGLVGEYSDPVRDDTGDGVRVVAASSEEMYLLRTGITLSQGDGIEPGSQVAWVEARDAMTGEVLWRIDTAETESVSEEPPIAVVVGIVEDQVVIADGSEVSALALDDGAVTWSAQLGTSTTVNAPSGGAAVGPGESATGSVRVLDSMIAVEQSGDPASIHLLDSATGDEVRSVTTDVYGGGDIDVRLAQLVPVGDELVGVTASSDDLEADDTMIAVGAGGVRSVALPIAGEAQGSMAVIDPSTDTLVIQYSIEGSNWSDGPMTAVDIATGETRWAMDQADVERSGAALFGDPGLGYILVSSSASGQMAALDSMTGDQVAAGSWSDVVEVPADGQLPEALHRGMYRVPFGGHAGQVLTWGYGMLLDQESGSIAVTRMDSPVVALEDGEPVVFD